MVVIGKSSIVAFGKKHNQAKKALAAWLKVAEEAQWRNLMEVRKNYPSADGGVRRLFTVFNIAGNKYRLTATIDYELQTVAVTNVFTHSEYDHWSKS